MGGCSARWVRTARARPTSGTGEKGWPSPKCMRGQDRSTRSASTHTRQEELGQFNHVNPFVLLFDGTTCMYDRFAFVIEMNHMNHTSETPWPNLLSAVHEFRIDRSAHTFRPDLCKGSSKAINTSPSQYSCVPASTDVRVRYLGTAIGLHGWKNSEVFHLTEHNPKLYRSSLQSI